MSLSSGITSSPRKLRVQKGSGRVTPSSRAARSSSCWARATSSRGASERSPATGRGRSASTRSPAAAAMPPPASATARAAVSMEASSLPRTIRLWWSWATVLASAPRRSPKPATNPRPTRPLPWWRSITASLARSRDGSGPLAPRSTSSARVTIWPGTTRITRARPAVGRSNPTRSQAIRTVSRSACGGPGRGPPGEAVSTLRPARYTATGRGAERSSQSTRSARRPGATAPRSESP